MDLQLKGKTVLISGSTSGIGFSVARTFLKEGASVCINGRTEESVARAVHQLKADFPNGKIEGAASDFSKAEEVEP